MKTSKDNFKDYFSEEIRNRISAMSEDQMYAILRDLEGSDTWIAIVKYSNARLQIAQNALVTIDPIKDPTSMCRYQGIMSGISDLQDCVISLKNGEKKKQ